MTICGALLAISLKCGETVNDIEDLMNVYAVIGAGHDRLREPVRLCSRDDSTYEKI